MLRPPPCPAGAAGAADAVVAASAPSAVRAATSAAPTPVLVILLGIRGLIWARDRKPLLIVRMKVSPSLGSCRPAPSGPLQPAGMRMPWTDLLEEIVNAHNAKVTH